VSDKRSLGQPKNVAFPTDARLLHRAREKLVRLARQLGVPLRQSYCRIGKLALIQHQRYAHAKQFKRARKPLRKLKTYLRRVIRDIGRKVDGDDLLTALFAPLLSRAWRVLTQKKRQTAPKVYSMHAPEVECIGKGKAHKPYEFGVKVSVTTTIHRSKGGQFIIHAKALPGNPYDGHTLASVLPGIEATTGVSLKRIIADAGYKGHNAPAEHKFKVYIQKQKRKMTAQIKRILRRRAAVEPVIGHGKNEHRMDRNYLAHSQGDAVNAVMAAAGYNFRRLIRWLDRLLRVILLWLAWFLEPANA
jgi:IS5 family transposase